MSVWRWVAAGVVHAIHDRQITEHGGLEGLRDPGLIEAALGRPRHRAAYGKPDAADLAAVYALALARCHGYVDGNKRTAWVVARLFLADNGFRLGFEPTEAVRVMEAVAAGALSEAELADWFRSRLGPTAI